jgi:putative peptide zinc metalloprotease protein
MGIALKVYLLGALMAAFYASTVLWGAGRKLVFYLGKSPETAAGRPRAIAVGMVALIGVPLGIAAVPVDWPIEISGVIAAEDETPVYAQAAGFLRTSQIQSGQRVEIDTSLYVLDNIQTVSAVTIAQAQFDIARLRAASQFEQSPAQAAITAQQAEYLRQALHQTQEDVERLSASVPIAGNVVDCDDTLQAGRFVKKGERVATIISGGWTVRALATAQDLADIEPQVGQTVRVRLLGHVVEELSGTITKVAVTGSTAIPSASLTQLGGGSIAVAPDTMTAQEPYFEITIELDTAGHNLARRGMSAQISFPAKPQTIGVRLYRAGLRFLNKLRT